MERNIDMRQDAEEAAKEYLSQFPWEEGDKLASHICEFDFKAGFKAGAEWQAKQSSWININDRLPENKDDVLVLSRMNISGKYFVSSDSYDGKEWAVNLAMHYTRVAWIPIPSFDEILEASKDVLQRMKENGD